MLIIITVTMIIIFTFIIIPLQALQCSLILLILAITVATNISIVLNIHNSEIKKRIVSFLLIKNLCIVDTVGAMLILPVPLAATFKGVRRCLIITI